MKESPFVEQIMLVGDNRRFVSALIVPSFAKLKEWSKQHGIEYVSNAEIIKIQWCLPCYKIPLMSIINYSIR